MNKVQNIRYMRSAGGKGRWDEAVARKLASNGSTLECQRSWVIHVPERRQWVGVTKTYREEFIWVEDEGKRRLTSYCPYTDPLITTSTSTEVSDLGRSLNCPTALFIYGQFRPQRARSTT